MSKISAAALGTQPIGPLLVKQAVPASIGILVMSLNVLVDSIFVGNWIGALGIAAINVVLPVSFFIAALGMAIGIGGSSIISRALGAEEHEKATTTFGNQIALTVLITVSMAALGLYFMEGIIPAFGGQGANLPAGQNLLHHCFIRSAFLGPLYDGQYASLGQRENPNLPWWP